MYFSTTVPRLVFFYFLPPFFGSKLLSTSCMLDRFGDSIRGISTLGGESKKLGLFFFFEDFVW